MKVQRGNRCITILFLERRLKLLLVVKARPRLLLSLEWIAIPFTEGWVGSRANLSTAHYSTIWMSVMRQLLFLVTFQKSLTIIAIDRSIHSSRHLVEAKSPCCSNLPSIRAVSTNFLRYTHNIVVITGLLSSKLRHKTHWMDLDWI
jgi:hypothetical protein